MMIEICSEEKQMIAIANKWLIDRVTRYQARSIFLPAGRTPMPLYAAWRQNFPKCLDALDLQQIDEVLNDPKEGIFANFFATELPARKVRTITNIEERLDYADLAILGFGKNGHVGFHEPGIPADFLAGEIQLSEESKKTLQLGKNAKGWSYGIGTFLKAKAILLVVWGGGKEKSWQDFLNDEKIPAVFLKSHPDLTVIVEERLTSQV